MSSNKNFSVQDILQLLYSNGAGKTPKSPIRIWDYFELIPNRGFINRLRKIGQGGYGSVYVINIDGLDYAFKIMTQKRGETQQKLIDNFYKECRSLLSVNHERVLRLIGVAIDISEEGSYCFCHYTNYQQKGNLYELIKSGLLFPEAPQRSQQRYFKKIRLISQIAEGIHAIHAAGLIHRDIKSLNVLIDENYTPKIADLGLAEDNSESSAYEIRGTIQWMAPEVFDYRVSPASDI